MMITKTSYVERVLIVLSPEGALVGAHQESLEQIRDGDDVISTRMLPAAPLAETALASILPTQAALIAQVQALQVLLEEAQQAATSAVESRSAAEASNADLTAQAGS